MSSSRKIAVVHDWLITYAGSERVLEQMLECYPEADLFTVVDFLPESERGFLKQSKIQTSLIQKLPAAKKRYRQYLPLMPMAINRLNLSGYNLILSSSHAVAKGVSKKANQLHLSYIHTPMRYAWDLRKQYLTESGLNGGLKGFLVNRMLDYIKKWDLKNTSSVDAFMANSHFIAGRIKNNYGRDAQVIYPPVKVVSFPFNKGKDDFYLTASRFVPYKRIDLIVESFNRLPNRNLVVIGDGPDWEKVKFKANKNVSLIGYAENDLLKEYMRRARAFVFAAEEDFGIAVVEAQACGTPVVAFGRGGALETVISIGQKKPTGVFFQEQKINSLIDGIENFEKHEKEILPENCRENALRFTPERFRKEFTNFVESQWNIFQGWN